MKRFLHTTLIAPLLIAACTADVAPETEITLLDPDGRYDRAGLAVYLTGVAHSKTLAFDCLTTCDVSLAVTTRFEGPLDPGPLVVDVRGPGLDRAPLEVSGAETLAFAALAPGRYTVGLKRAQWNDAPLSAQLEAQITAASKPFPGGHARLMLSASARSEDRTHLTFMCEEEGGCDAAFYAKVTTLADALPIPLAPNPAHFSVRLSDELEDFGELAFERVGVSDVYVARRWVDPWAPMHLDAQTGSRRIRAILGAEWSPVGTTPDAVAGVTALLDSRQSACTEGGRRAALDAEATRALEGEVVDGADVVQSDLPIAAELVHQVASLQELLDRVSRCEAFGVATSTEPTRFFELAVVTRPE
jgi:hypothetical protein